MIGVPRFEYDEISSTNDVARTAALNGIAEGAIFLAAHQTAGRGRRGAAWIERPGESVLMTVVLYPNGAVSSAWRLGWMACVAVIESMRALGVQAACKWPNDVVTEGRKIAGVLVETVPLPSGRYAALVGIGVNVQQAEFDSWQSYRLPPTSVRLEIKSQAPEIDEVAARLCEDLERYYSPDGATWDQVATTYASSIVIGEAQAGTCLTTGRLLSGVLAEVRESDGAALLQVGERDFRYVCPELTAAS